MPTSPPPETRYLAYPGYCYRCFHTPLVAVRLSWGWDFTTLCGRCYFGALEYLDPSTWSTDDAP